MLHRKIATYFLLAIFTVSGLYAQGGHTVESIPNTRLRDASSHVSNPDGILSASAVAEINRVLAGLESSDGIEAAVVVVGSIASDAPEEFTVDLFRRWGIGTKGKDNGLLIFLATQDRFVRFEVGYGLEGDLPDAIAKRIQTMRMQPYLQAGDWDNAMIAGVQGVYEYLHDPDSPLANAAGDTDAAAGFLSMLIFTLIAMFGIVFIALLAQRRRNKCPRCGTKMRQTATNTYKIDKNIRRTQTTLTCPNCGYTMNKHSDHYINPGGYIGGALGGGLGGLGGGRGGGLGGGSWGGGRSGGGGATTRF